ncbi:MAG: TIGR02186 family protein [Desulfobacteraceae bacterium]
MRRLIQSMLLLACLGLGLAVAPAARAAQSDKLSIRPEMMDIGTFYSGGIVNVSGDVPAGQDVIVEITGPDVDNQFDIKGKVGPFWMTRDRAELDRAPAMYVLLLPGGSPWVKKTSALGLGLENLKRKMTIESTTLPPDDLFEMFLKLKTDQGLYVEKENAVTYETVDDGSRRFSAEYRFPRATSAGTYSIKATYVADGVKKGVRTQRFMVDEVGFTRLVDDLATNQRLTYGILAVVIALFTGALMGFLFKGGGSH